MLPVRPSSETGTPATARGTPIAHDDLVGETTAVTRTRALKGGYFGSASDRRPAMLTRTGSVLAVLACCSCFLSTAQAQKVEEDDVQVLKPVASPQMPAKSAKLPEAAKRVLALTNELRKDKERDKVEINPQLVNAAQAFAEYMARTSRYGHQADGSTPADRAQKAGFKYCIIAENIAYAYDSDGFTTDALADELIGGWKASPG